MAGYPKMPSSGGLSMWNMGSTPSFSFSSMTALTLLCALLVGIAWAEDGQESPGLAAGKSGRVLGLAFESLQVSDLKKSVDYYQMLGFIITGDANQPWTKDEAANRLYNTPGAMSRTVVLRIASTASGRPFTLYLREYKDIGHGNRKDFPGRNPSSTHIGLRVPEADALWAKLQLANLLRPLSWEGKLIRMPGQTSGGLAYVRDPDGFNIEIIGLSPQPAKTADRRTTPANHPTLHHLGLTVLNYDKSKVFYGNLLGAKFPDALPAWVSGDNYDAVVGGHGYVIRLINGAFPEIAAPQTTMPFELVLYQKPDITEIADYRYSDVSVSCVGIQVDGLDGLYARLKTAGIKIWSEGGISKRKDGTRALVVRDPDVGAFVELFEKP
jgi:catechol 2,3-dioxygenase-like lactoylglutathione lyase family enzyme